MRENTWLSNVPSVNQYKSVLQDGTLSKRQLQILNIVRNSRGASITPQQLAKECGYKHKHAANLIIGTIGKRISEAINMVPKTYARGQKIAYFSLVGPYFPKDGWRMESNLVKAIDSLYKNDGKQL